MIYPSQMVRIWLTAAGAGELVPRVFDEPEFDAILQEEDHHGFWVLGGKLPEESEHLLAARLVRKDFVACIQLGLPDREEGPASA